MIRSVTGSPSVDGWLFLWSRLRLSGQKFASKEAAGVGTLNVGDAVADAARPLEFDGHLCLRLAGQPAL
jgi:hypothetical protein